MTFTVAATSVGLATSGQHDVVLPPKVIMRDTVKGSVGLATVPPQSQMPSQAYANYAMGSQVSFLFQG